MIATHAAAADAYKTAVTIGIIITPAIVLGWWLDTRGDRADRRERARLRRECSDFIKKHFDDGLITPFEAQRRMVEHLYPMECSPEQPVTRARMTRLDSAGQPTGRSIDVPIKTMTTMWPARGTIQNPTDPSPTPRKKQR